MEIILSPDPQTASHEAALGVARLLRTKPDAVLGLATGSTPLPLYHELIQMHRKDGLNFSRVTTFNLDEYIGLPAEHPQSYHHFMWENLFRHLNIPKERVHLPDGMARDIPGACEAYERATAEGPVASRLTFHG